jgi:hypothetical protein
MFNGTNIFDYFLRTCKGRFGKDHPFFGDFMIQPLSERKRICKVAKLIGELEESFCMGFYDTFEKLGPKDPGQCLNRKEKVFIILGVTHSPASFIPPAVVM